MPDKTDWRNRWKTSPSCATLDPMSEDEPTEAEKNLRAFRSEIDEIDRKIAALLTRRHEISVNIGKQKQSLGVQVLDDARERYVLDRVTSQARDSNGADFIRQVYQSILQGSRAAQHDNFQD